jgi:mono/diheme cytochrome c family protein
MVTTDPRAAQYYDNADAVNTGKRLFQQYNCSGCHSNGGGGMGRMCGSSGPELHPGSSGSTLAWFGAPWQVTSSVVRTLDFGYSR